MEQMVNMVRLGYLGRLVDAELGAHYSGMMPRTARASVGGMWYHALNRGNHREVVFHKPGDFDAFVAAMGDACARLPLDLLGYCVMPNHFHLVLRPRADGDLEREKGDIPKSL